MIGESVGSKLSAGEFIVKAMTLRIRAKRPDGSRAFSQLKQTLAANGMHAINPQKTLLMSVLDNSR